VGVRVLVVGGGGREHALVWKLAQSPRVGALWCAPGNPGTAELAESLPLAATNVDGLPRAAERLAVDLVVVGPEAPLAAGLADRLIAAGIPVCGPSRSASRIETSKAWAKEVMAEAGVPTARSVVVDEIGRARAALAGFGLPVVVKADGLAAGKGVVVAERREDAAAALAAFLERGALGEAGRRVVIEEHLAGEEVSVIALTDGERLALLPPARDHKRIFDGDRGPNTGGMGAYAPAPSLDATGLAEVERAILRPTLAALAGRGAPFRGALFAGLMLTGDGPKVLEFNARFGDPEAQAILPLLDGDLLSLVRGAAGEEELPASVPSRGAAVAVTLASGGYPGAFGEGVPIRGLERVPADVLVFHAGTERAAGGELVTAGGRVLTVVGRGEDLAAARERAYAGVDAISFRGMRLRRDIAAPMRLDAG